MAVQHSHLLLLLPYFPCSTLMIRAAAHLMCPRAPPLRCGPQSVRFRPFKMCGTGPLPTSECRRPARECAAYVAPLHSSSWLERSKHWGRH